MVSWRQNGSIPTRAAERSLRVSVASEGANYQRDAYYDQQCGKEGDVEAEEDDRGVDHGKKGSQADCEDAQFEPHRGPNEVEQEHQEARTKSKDGSVDDVEGVPTFQRPEYSEPNQKDPPEHVRQGFVLH